MADEFVLELESNLSIAQAESLGELMEAQFRQGVPVIVDASGVERIDTAILQLLYSFSASMASAGASVVIQNPSEVFSESAMRLGLDSFLITEDRKNG